MIHPSVKVASVFASPVMLNKAATVAKACRLIQEAAKNGAELIVFPESFIPGFPIWTSYTAPINGHELFIEFAKNSIAVSGPEMTQIAQAAEGSGIFVSMGFSERSDVSAGCLWNSNVLIDDHGELINHHRKLVPTFYEKLVWASGDGAGLKVSKTRIGNIGSLICGENNNTLARYTLLAEGEQIHTGSFPSVWPFRNPLTNTRIFDIAEANRIRMSSHCFEGKVFAVISSSHLDEESISTLAGYSPEAEEILMVSPRATSMIIGPEGDLIAKCGADKECLVYAELDLKRIIALKQHHDLVGYYNRFDVFELSVNRARLKPIHLKRDAGAVSESMGRLNDRNVDGALASERVDSETLQSDLAVDGGLAVKR